MDQMTPLYPIINHVYKQAIKSKYLLMVSSIIFLGLPTLLTIKLTSISSTILIEASTSFPSHVQIT